MALTVSQISAKDFHDLKDDVRALQHMSAQPNVFIDPAIACASDVKPDVLIAFHDNKRVGVWPLYWRGKIIEAQAHLYSMLSFPLLQRGSEAQVFAAFMAHLKNNAKRASALRLRHWPQEQLALLPATACVLSHGVRGVMKKEEGVFSESVLSASTRRSLAKQKKRMEKTGAVDYVSLQGRAALAQLGSFFALEQSGWKGKRRTAIASRAQNKAFITQAAEKLSAEDVMLSYFSVADEMTAAGLILHAAGNYWFWKIAYDERAASLSPGVHYAKALCEDISNRTGFVVADSCAPLGAGRHVAFCKTPQHFVDVIVPLQDVPGFAFRARVFLLRAHLRVRNAAKRFFGLLR